MSKGEYWRHSLVLLLDGRGLSEGVAKLGEGGEQSLREKKLLLGYE